VGAGAITSELTSADMMRIDQKRAEMKTVVTEAVRLF
jgi:hypothetical protein